MKNISRHERFAKSPNNPASTTTSSPISDIQRLAQETPADEVMVITLGSDNPGKLLHELSQLDRPCKVMLHLDQKGVAAEALLGALKNIPCIQHLHGDWAALLLQLSSRLPQGLAGSGLVSLAFDLEGLERESGMENLFPALATCASSEATHVDQLPLRE